MAVVMYKAESRERHSKITAPQRLEDKVGLELYEAEVQSSLSKEGVTTRLAAVLYLVVSAGGVSMHARTGSQAARGRLLL